MVKLWHSKYNCSRCQAGSGGANMRLARFRCCVCMGGGVDPLIYKICTITMSVRGEYRFMKFMEKNKGWCSLECLFTSQISYRHRYCAYTYYFSLSLPLSLARSHTDTEPRNKCLLCCCRRCRTIQKRGFISFNSRGYDGTGAVCVCVCVCMHICTCWQRPRILSPSRLHCVP